MIKKPYDSAFSIILSVEIISSTINDFSILKINVFR